MSQHSENLPSVFILLLFQLVIESFLVHINHTQINGNVLHSIIALHCVERNQYLGCVKCRNENMM